MKNRYYRKITSNDISRADGARQSLETHPSTRGKLGTLTNAEVGHTSPAMGQIVGLVSPDLHSSPLNLKGVKVEHSREGKLWKENQRWSPMCWTQSKHRCSTTAQHITPTWMGDCVFYCVVFKTNLFFMTLGRYSKSKS